MKRGNEKMVKFKISDQADVVLKNTKTGEVAYQGTVQVKDMSSEDFSTTKTPKIRFADTHYEACLLYTSPSPRD